MKCDFFVFVQGALVPVVGILRKCELTLLAGLISRIIDFNLKIILASAKLFTKPSVSLWTEQVLNFAPLLFI